MAAELRSASAIVMSTPEAVAAVRRSIPELASKKLVAIPNGFEPADFDVPAADRSDEKLRIVHTGYLHTELGKRYDALGLARRLLGGRDNTVNVLTRSHVYLLQAIEALARSNPSILNKVEVHLAGVLSRADREIAERSAVVRAHGYLSHPDAVALMKSADLLFLPMHDLPAGRRATIVPGKTYDYLAAQRPILAAVPDGDARDLLERAGNAILCRPADIDGISSAILNSLRKPPTSCPDSAVLRKYEYRSLAERLARVFDYAVRSESVHRGNGRQSMLTSQEAHVGSSRRKKKTCA